MEKKFDKDGSVISILEARVRPNEVSFSEGNASKTEVSGFVSGVYEFSLTVQDNDSLTGTDMVKVLVNNLPSHVGDDQTIEWPTSSTVLRVLQDSDGQVKSVLWKQEKITVWLLQIKLLETEVNSLQGALMSFY